MPVLTIAILVFAAVSLLILGVLRPEGSLLSASNADSLRERITIKLRRAGITSIDAYGLMTATIAASLLSGAAIFIATGSLILGGMALVAVPFAVNSLLDAQTRRFNDRLLQRMVRFLRRVESQVRIGRNPTQAFSEAARDDELIGWVLRDQLASLQLQRNLVDVLNETLEAIPLRSWVQFVRAMESYTEGGGDLANLLDTNIRTLNDELVLRRKLAGDVGMYRSLQKILLATGILSPIGLYFVTGGQFGMPWQGAANFIGFIFSLGIIAGAIYYMNSRIRAVEGMFEN